MTAETRSGAGAAETSAGGTPLTIEDILEILPHRPPMLLVDRVTEVTPGEKIVALKSISAKEPFLEGHFPGRPIMPGVLVLEAMAQASALLVHATEPFDATSHTLLLLGIDGARFRRLVGPGDQLVIEATVSSHKKSVWRLKARAFVASDVAAEATFLASVGEDLG